MWFVIVTVIALMGGVVWGRKVVLAGARQECEIGEHRTTAIGRRRR